LVNENLEKLVWVSRARNQTLSWPLGLSRRFADGPNLIAPSRLRVTGTVFEGRDQEHDLLDRAWASGEDGSKSKINILSLIAQGGAGKTALVLDWRARLCRCRLARSRSRLRLVFFIVRALAVSERIVPTRFSMQRCGVGEAYPEQLTGWAKGERLAALVAEQRTLLILDGLEPLQRPPGALAVNSRTRL